MLQCYCRLLTIDTDSDAKVVVWWRARVPAPHAASVGGRFVERAKAGTGA
jgi:hypothetical protein